MKILIQADCLDNQRAGVHHYLKNLLKDLISKYPKDEYTLIRLQKATIGTSINQIAISRPQMILGGTFRLLFKMPKIIRKISPDLFWSPTHLLPPFLPKKTLKVVTIHDLTSITHPQFHTFMNKLGHKLFLKRSLKKADIIICVSNTVATQISQKYNPPGKVTTIYNGLNKKPKTSPNSPVTFPYIVYIGTLEPRKNLELLMQTFLKTNLPHKLILIGDYGWKSEKIHELIKKNPEKIIYKGYLNESEKNNYLVHATCLVYPSIFEGFGLPPLEAMQMGVPVICSTGGALEELYANVALCFKPDDHHTLQKHLIDISTNEITRQKYSKLGQEFSTNFSWKKAAEQLHNLIQNAQSHN